MIPLALFAPGPAALAGHDADVTAWIAAVKSVDGSVVSARQAALTQSLVSALKACGAWALRDDYAVYAAESRTAALVTLKQRLTQTLSATAPTFTANQGFAGNGSSAYVDTKWNPHSSLTNYTRNSANFGVWMSVGATGNNQAYIGNDDNGSTEAKWSTSGGGTLFADINANANLSWAVGTAPTGWISVERSSSMATALYANGLLKASSSSDGSVSLLNDDFLVLATQNGGPVHFCGGTASVAAIGGALGAPVGAAEYAALNAYMAWLP